VADCCEHDNESSGSMKCSEILEFLCDWRLVKDLLSVASVIVKKRLAHSLTVVRVASCEG
jgi:hypothetical protein